MLKPFETRSGSRFGASMGRVTNWTGDPGAGAVRLERVKISSGGYDPGGAYWGVGLPIYCAWAPGTEFVAFVRSPTRTQAKEDFQKGAGRDLRWAR